MTNRKILKINDKQDYEKGGFKSMMKDVEKTKKETLESVPQIPREQILIFLNPTSFNIACTVV
jgi:hypothetical protein